MKTKKLLLIIVCMCTTLTFSCQEKKKTSTVEDLFEKNVQTCMMPIMKYNNIDSVTAREVCSCALGAALQIDSSFLYMSGNKASEFLEIHRKTIEEKCNLLEQLKDTDM